MTQAVLKNNQTIPLADIPELDYDLFREAIILSMKKGSRNHCVNYFGFPYQDKIKLICCIANDELNTIHVTSSVVDAKQPLSSFSKQSLVFEKFEREIHENYGIHYTDHPWLKPVRFAMNRFNKNATVAGYPFFNIESEELHEVGVGPIHAGIIEPGHFRFICNGEQILHLEIQLGYQHRGIEQLFPEKKKLLQQITLAENITGDTVVGHAVAYVNLLESMCNYQPGSDIRLVRTLALELERVAMHTVDLSGLCTDIAYQLGSAVYGRLRTPVINYFQSWCGNRFAKGLIRAGRNNYPLTKVLADELITMLDAYEKDFEDITEEMFSLPSALSRFEKTGVISAEQAADIGTVGMTARMSGINRDIRSSHAHDLYTGLQHQPVIKHHGDVFSRAQVRKEEIRQSIKYIRQWVRDLPPVAQRTIQFPGLAPNSFTISLVEGWRGEICHCAVSGDHGEFIHYKIKDPSFHNWLALALSVRNNEISDFPVCNKSFDLSYCGHDL